MRARGIVTAVLAFLLLASGLAHALRVCAISRHDVQVATGHCAAHAPDADPTRQASDSEPEKVPSCCDPSVAIAAIPCAKATLAVADEARQPGSVTVDVAYLRRLRGLTTARLPVLAARWAPHRFGGVRDHLAQATLLI